MMRMKMFSDATKAVQQRKGSRAAYARVEARGGFERELTGDVVGFIESTITAFFATASSDGQPYVQHRGGPPGFLHVLDAHTVAFADLKGNRQYISLGNLSENPKVHLLLMDYETRQRVKLWGTATVSEDPELIGRLTAPGEQADQAIVISVDAWDANCPQHIPQLISADKVERALAARGGPGSGR
ncbi:MAG: pyridoxamine 5'-phosphate oxidase family protein [Archangiaceae bacterium]|nr:pyridoxamine 5'-phosphate oxidase family protein [Archangiaceae bacterium]